MRRLQSGEGLHLNSNGWMLFGEWFDGSPAIAKKITWIPKKAVAQTEVAERKRPCLQQSWAAIVGRKVNWGNIGCLWAPDEFQLSSIWLSQRFDLVTGSPCIHKLSLNHLDPQATLQSGILPKKYGARYRYAKQGCG